jgi:hypothetical protein
MPKPYPMTSTDSINSMLIHTIISWHVQMMLLINGFGVGIRPMWVMLRQFCGLGITKICLDLPTTFRQKPYQMTSTDSINSMLIHTIISWHVQMMLLINDFGVGIWPVWVMLRQFCGLGITKICLDLPATFRQKPYQMTSTDSINSMLIHTIISWHVQMMLINGFGVGIWPVWVMLGHICVLGITKVNLLFCPTTEQ